MVVFELLQSLNLGEQVMTAAMLAIAGWYLLRGKSMAGTIARTVGTATTIVIGTLGLIAVGIALNWFDPRPGVVVGHVTTAVGTVVEFAGQRAVEFVTELVP